MAAMRTNQQGLLCSTCSIFCVSALCCIELLYVLARLSRVLADSLPAPPHVATLNACVFLVCLWFRFVKHGQEGRKVSPLALCCVYSRADSLVLGPFRGHQHDENCDHDDDAGQVLDLNDPKILAAIQAQLAGRSSGLIERYFVSFVISF
jgi:hypothetical protein